MGTCIDEKKTENYWNDDDDYDDDIDNDVDDEITLVIENQILTIHR